MTTKEVWYKVFSDLYFQGKEYSPRGKKIIELENYSIKFHPINDRFCSFKERKLSLSYNFLEWIWYLSADRNNIMMEYYSPFWKQIKNKEEPFYNSNYGHYIFNEYQFEYVINTLKDDKDSRQAIIVINNKDIMMSDSMDKLCTNTITFNIRNNSLNMYVDMRSNCVITGLGIDANMFSFLYECIFLYLKEKYIDLKIGEYHHKAISFHIYEKDWKIMNDIVNSQGKNYFDISIPLISSTKEVEFMRKYLPQIEHNFRAFKNSYIEIDNEFNFTQKIVNVIKKRCQEV